MLTLNNTSKIFMNICPDMSWKFRVSDFCAWHLQFLNFYWKSYTVQRESSKESPPGHYLTLLTSFLPSSIKSYFNRAGSHLMTSRGLWWSHVIFDDVINVHQRVMNGLALSGWWGWLLSLTNTVGYFFLFFVDDIEYQLVNLKRDYVKKVLKYK